MPLGPEDGLSTICAANLDSMTTVPKDMLQRHIASLGSEKLQDVEDAIHFALGLET